MSLRPLSSSFNGDRLFPGTIGHDDNCVDNRTDDDNIYDADTLSRALDAAHAEEAWSQFARLMESPEDLLSLPTADFLRLMATLTRHSVKDRESLSRILKISSHLRQRLLSQDEYNSLLVQLADGGAFAACLDVIADMQRLKVDLEQSTFEHIVYMQILSRQVDSALKFSSSCTSASSSGESPSLAVTSSLFSKMIVAFSFIRDPASAVKTLDAMIRASFQPLESDYLAILRSFFVCGRVDKAEEWLTKMFDRGVVISPKVMAEVARGYSPVNLEKTLKWFNDHASSGLVGVDADADTSLINSVLRSHIVFNSIEEGGIFIKQAIEQRGFRPNHDTFHILMDAFVKAKDMASAKSIMDTQMPAHGLNPNVTTYSIAINGLVRSKNVPMALDMLDEMRDAHIAPSLITYTTLINGYAKTGRVDDAIDVFNHIKESGMTLDSIACTTLMFGLAFSGRYEECFKMYQCFADLNLDLSDYTYTALIFSCSKRGDHEMAETIFQNMLDEGIEPTIYQYNALLVGYVVKEDPAGAMSLLNQFKEREVIPNIGTYNILMEIASFEGRVDKILKFFQVLFNDPEVKMVDSYTISHVIGLLCKHENTHAMVSTFDALRMADANGKVQLKSNNWFTYISCLLQLEKFDLVKPAIESMVRAGHIPNSEEMGKFLIPLKAAQEWDILEQIVDFVEKAELPTLPSEEPSPMLKSVFEPRK